MTEHQLNHVSHGGTCIDDSVNELSHLECAAEKFRSSGFTHAMSEKTRHQEASSMSSKAEQNSPVAYAAARRQEHHATDS